MPKHPGIVYEPDTDQNYFLLAIPKALTTIPNGKLNMSDGNLPIDMNTVWIFEPLGQLGEDCAQSALDTFRLLGRMRIQHSSLGFGQICGSRLTV